MSRGVLKSAVCACAIGISSAALADPVPMPSMSASLSANPNPFSVDAGPLGKIYIDGALTGLGFWQSNHVPGDHSGWLDLNNGQVFVQKTDGWLQFFVQAGVYSLPSLGTEYFRSTKLLDDTYGVCRRDS